MAWPEASELCDPDAASTLSANSGRRKSSMANLTASRPPVLFWIPKTPLFIVPSDEMNETALISVSSRLAGSKARKIRELHYARLRERFVVEIHGADARTGERR